MITRPFEHLRAINSLSPLRTPSLEPMLQPKLVAPIHSTLPGLNGPDCGLALSPGTAFDGDMTFPIPKISNVQIDTRLFRGVFVSYRLSHCVVLVFVSVPVIIGAYHLLGFMTPRGPQANPRQSPTFNTQLHAVSRGAFQPHRGGIRW